MDIKTIQKGSPHYRQKSGSAVERRANMVPKEYARHAIRLDKEYHRTPKAVRGPIQARLETFPAVRGLVVGGYGESSIDILSLVKLAANKAAPKNWKRMGAKDEKHACGIIIASLKRTWGTVFARSMAGVRMARRIFAGQERRRPGGI